MSDRGKIPDSFIPTENCGNRLITSMHNPKIATKAFVLPGTSILKTAPIQESKFGEKDGRDERHFQQFLQTHVHLKLVLFFLGHERRHTGAASVCHAESASRHRPPPCYHFNHLTHLLLGDWNNMRARHF